MKKGELKLDFGRLNVIYIRIRINSNGTIRLNSFIGNSGSLYVDSSGVLKTNVINPAILTPCAMPNPIWSAFTTGELFTCPSTKVGIGTYSIPSNVRLKVNGNSWMDGMVGIGIDPTSITLAAGASNYKLVVNGKIGATEIYCYTGSQWPDYVFEKSYEQKTLSEIENFLTLNKHLPGIPTTTEIQTEGLPIAEMQRLQMEKIEEIYLYLIKLEKDNLELRKQIDILINSK